MRDLKDRTRDFALRVLKLCSSIPSNRTNDVMARQLTKSGTSPGAHFREALRARSHTEYVAKLNGGLMELEETAYWLELLEGQGVFTHHQLEDIRQETTELAAIFTSLIKKWKRR